MTKLVILVKMNIYRLEVSIIEAINVWQSALSGSWNQVWYSTLLILPRILGAILVLSIGLILAYWVKRLIVQGLKLVKFESLTKGAGVEGYLRKADIKLTLSEIVATFFEWILVIVFFLAATEVLGLTAISAVLAGILGYVPNILAAALIFAASIVVAKLVDGLVRGAVAGIDREVSKPAGRMARYVILIVGFFAAIDQLQIAQGLISTFFQGLTYTIVLVVGLSVGLGAKDLVSKALTDWYDKIKK